MKRAWKRAALAAAALVTLAPASSRAVDRFWTNTSGGVFSTSTNWSGGFVAGPADFAHFQNAGSTTYAVTFTAATTNTMGMYVHNDNVTWNLGGNTYNQSGSTAFDPFLIGQNAGENGSLTINNGNVNTSIASGSFNTVIGKAGGGTLTLNNAANWTITTPLLVGQSNNGTFNVNPGGSVIVANSMFLGGSTAAAAGGTVAGVVNLAGGSATVNGGLTIWNSGAAAPGGTRFNFSSGSLTVGSFGANTANSRFNWTGGTLSVTAADLSFNSIGPANFSFGSGAGQTLSTSRDQFVGNTAAQVVSQTGGSNTVGTVATPRNLYVGYFATGTYNLSGSSTLTVRGNETIGSNAAGTFVQSGGTHTVGGSVVVGAGAIGAPGTLQINGGSFTASSMLLGESTFGVSGALTVTGGTTSVAGLVDVAQDAGSVTMSGGTLSAGRLAVANSSALNWTGGTVNSTASISLSQSAAVAGDTTLFTSGGNLTLSSTKSLATSGSERIGVAAGAGGAGAVTQTGGSNTVAAALELGYGAASTGTYALQGGTVSAGNVYVGGNAVGSAGTGTLSISGGSLTSPGTLRVWNAGSSLTLSGGALAAATLDFGGDPSRFHWTGGSLTLTSGNLTLQAGGLIGDTVPAGASLAVTGGSLTNNGTVNLAGSTVSGVGITNNALITGYGTIGGSGLVTNAASGHIIQSGGYITYANSAVLVNAGTITLAPGYQFNASNGGGVTNNATLNLNGGTLVSAITNTVSGTLSGPGTITGTLDNSGMIDLPTGTLNLPSFINAGVIALGSNGANLAGGITITNNGTLEGVGKVVANVTNNNTIQTGAGTLWFAAAPQNTSAGTIVVGAGGKILITAPPSNNAGTITLAGGTLDVNGGGLTNSSNGHITGFGTIRAAALTNNGGGTGAITFSGSAGALIFGNVTNKSASKMIVTGDATATFNDAVTNQSGSEFRVSGGATAVFLGAVSGAGSFTGSGTKIFEASGSPSSLTTGVGDTVIQAAAAVSTAALAEDAVTVNGGLLTLTAGAPAAATVNTLTTTGAGRFDLTDNSMVIRNMTVPQVQALIQVSFNAGHWDSGAGLTSSTAAASTITAVGFASNAVLEKSSFKGVENLTANDVLVKYTYYGDSDLSGATTLDDFTLFLGGYTGGGSTWLRGDYNYSGSVTLDDFNLFLAGYRQQGGPLSGIEALINGAPMTAADRAAMLAAVAATVPEPAMGLMALALTAVLGKMARRRAPTGFGSPRSGLLSAGNTPLRSTADFSREAFAPLPAGVTTLVLSSDRSANASRQT